MKPLFFTLGLSLSLLIGGCAVSPQSIVLSPQTILSGPTYGQGRALTVNIEDRRSNSVLGSRGGVYESSSVITISNDITGALMIAAQASTAQLGFDGSSASAPAQLTLILEELTYDTKTKGLVISGSSIARPS